MSYHTKKNGIEVSPTFEEVRETIRKESNFGLVLTFVEWIHYRGENLHFAGTVYSSYSDDCNSDLKIMMEDKFITPKPDFDGEIMMSSN